VRSIISFPSRCSRGIPSVVYGLWGLFVPGAAAPRARGALALRARSASCPSSRGPPIGLGYLAAGVILAIMILPTITSIAIEVLRTVPLSLREAALALGATRWEAIRMAVLPYARAGIMGATILGLGRALGETMAVTMLIGNIAHHLFLAVLAGLLLAGGDRERVRRGERRPAHRRPRGIGADPLRRHAAAQRGGPSTRPDLAARACAGGRMSTRMRRRAVNVAMTALCALGLLLALVPLASVLWLVVSKGIRGLNLDFFTQLPTPVGEPGGGVGNAILGSLYIVGIASAIGVASRRRRRRLPSSPSAEAAGPGDVIRFTAEVLSGVPSIIVGIVAYGLVVLPMRRFSALPAGSGSPC